MADKVSNINLDAHYTSNPKVERPARVVVSAPDSIPSSSLNIKKETDIRYKNVCNDVYDGIKTEEKKNSNKFWKIFGCIALAILGFKGLQKLFHK